MPLKPSRLLRSIDTPDRIPYRQVCLSLLRMQWSVWTPSVVAVSIKMREMAFGVKSREPSRVNLVELPQNFAPQNWAFRRVVVSGGCSRIIRWPKRKKNENDESMCTHVWAVRAWPGGVGVEWCYSTLVKFYSRVRICVYLRRWILFYWNVEVGRKSPKTDFMNVLTENVSPLHNVPVKVSK